MEECTLNRIGFRVIGFRECTVTFLTYRVLSLGRTFGSQRTETVRPPAQRSTVAEVEKRAYGAGFEVERLSRVAMQELSRNMQNAICDLCVRMILFRTDYAW